jgi:putative ABC transport system permease protein
MLANYIKIAFKVFLRRKFFTFIGLFGISFTLVVLMVATAALDNVFAPLPPEVNQDRSLYITRARMFGDQAGWGSAAGFQLLDKNARNLPGVELLSIYSDIQTIYTYPRGQKIGIELKRTDSEFWRILRFDFIEGGPYSTSDVEQARFVAVINRTVRGKLFGTASAVGRTIDADGRTFHVIGVVEDVPRLRDHPFAEMWAPYTTVKTDAYKTGLMGNFNAVVLAADRGSIPAIQAEFKSRIARVELPDPKEYTKLIVPMETTFEATSRELFSNFREEDSHAGRLWAAIVGAALLFMLLPTVNLVNLNVSRIMERASEIGVRKAFGASSRTLVGQFVVENLLLTLVGGAIGFALSVLVLRALTASGLIPYAAFRVNHRIFLYGMALAVFFGVFSGVYPAWRMSRMNPVEALKGASR